MNKYLEKIAEKEKPSKIQAVGRGLVEGLVGNVAGGTIGSVAGPGGRGFGALAGTLVGLDHGYRASIRNQKASLSKTASALTVDPAEGFHKIPGTDPKTAKKIVGLGNKGKGVFSLLAAGGAGIAAANAVHKKHPLYDKPTSGEVAKTFVGMGKKDLAAKYGTKPDGFWHDILHPRKDLIDLNNKANVALLSGMAAGGATGTGIGALAGKHSALGRKGSALALGALGLITGNAAALPFMAQRLSRNYAAAEHEHYRKKGLKKSASVYSQYYTPEFYRKADDLSHAIHSSGKPVIAKAGYGDYIRLAESAKNYGHHTGHTLGLALGHAKGHEEASSFRGLVKNKKALAAAGVIGAGAGLAGYMAGHNKSAELSDQTKKDIASTATIGASGALSNLIADKILHPNAPKGSLGKAALIGGGLGLIGDYGAVRLSNVINRKIDNK